MKESGKHHRWFLQSSKCDELYLKPNFIKKALLRLFLERLRGEKETLDLLVILSSGGPVSSREDTACLCSMAWAPQLGQL
jgi:hypothetical protein